MSLQYSFRTTFSAPRRESPAWVSIDGPIMCAQKVLRLIEVKQKKQRKKDNYEISI